MPTMTALAALTVVAMLVAQDAPVESRDELVTKSIEWMNTNLADPPSTRFQRVYVVDSFGQDKQRHVRICGQVLQDDAAAPPVWLQFASVLIHPGEVMTLIDRAPGGQIARLCSADGLEKWDYAHDLAPQFKAAMRRR